MFKSLTYRVSALQKTLSSCWSPNLWSPCPNLDPYLAHERSETRETVERTHSAKLDFTTGSYLETKILIIFVQPWPFLLPRSLYFLSVGFREWWMRSFQDLSLRKMTQTNTILDCCLCRLIQTMTFLTSIWEVSSSDLSSNWRFSYFSSVTTGKYRYGM